MVSKYQSNLNFFSEPNVINSYWAGFIAADGCIVKNSTQYVNLHLHKRDANHINGFSADAEADNPIRFGKNNDVSASYYYRDWVSDLDAVWNIRELKTATLEPPNIKHDEFKKAFIIGYIDGDGCWDWHRSKWGTYLRLQIDSTKSMLEWMAESLPGDAKTIYKTRGKNMYSLKYVGKKAKAVDEYLESPVVPRLDRKWYPRPWKQGVVSNA